MTVIDHINKPAQTTCFILSQGTIGDPITHYGYVTTQQLMSSAFSTIETFTDSQTYIDRAVVLGKTEQELIDAGAIPE